MNPELLLIGAVVAVGVLHTVVPDHWVPITLIARQRGWSIGQTARAAAIAGVGHTVSTLLLGAVVWLAGLLVAQRFAHAADLVSGVALIAFGLWIAIGAVRELGHAHDHGHAHHGHAHEHAHEGGLVHRHWHEHHDRDMHAEGAPIAHEHPHKTSGRTALLLIVGSSPMVEGIPAFFAAGKYGLPTLAIMAACFAASTIATYVLLCAGSVAGLARIDLGPLERYGEVASGVIVALVGVLFLAIGG